MSESMIHDLGIASLVFWSIIGILLIWYVWRIKKFNLNHDAPHKLEEEHRTEPLILENLRENEVIYDLQDETAPNNPEHPTH